MNGLAILFDLDGTLVDSIDGIHAASVHALEIVGREPPTKDRVSTCIGDGSITLMHRLLSGSMNGTVDEELHARAYEGFQSRYVEVGPAGSRCRDMAANTLQVLKNLGHPLAVVTNKNTDQAREVLDHLKLLPLLDVVVTGQEVGAMKPEPKSLHRAMDLLECSDGVMVGDSVVDLQAAAAATLPFIAIRGGYNRGRDIADESPAPHAVIDGLDEIPAVMGGLIR